MDLDEELDTMEDGAETEAEQTDEETELQDLEDFEDEGLGVDAEETDLEDAYEEFYYSEEGPEGEGESSDAGDGGLATMDAGETAELGGMGFHLVDEEEARATEDLVDEASGEEGAIRDYDGFAASEEDEELADDLANLADDDEGIEALDGIDDAAYQGFDDEDAAVANDGANDGMDAVPADAAGEDGEEDEEYEEVELEFSEEDIVCYLVDEDDNEIGFTLLDEDGNEVEYYYVEEGEGDDAEDNPFDLGITKEGVAQATSDMNAIYKDGVAVAAELKGAFDDIKSAFDFTGILKK